MKRGNVCLDFDDTIAQTHPQLVSWLKHQYGVQVPEGNFICGNSLDMVVNELLPPGKERITSNQIYDEFAKSFLTDEWQEGIEPIDGACEAIVKLASKYRLWIVTARQDSCRPWMEMFCQRHFSGAITGIHFVWKRVGPEKFEVNQTKKDFIASLTGEKVAFIDDNPGEVRKMEGIIPGHLFDPHHRHPNELMPRVRSWPEIGELLL